ncbi:Na+/H+ antiporter NhaA [Chromatiaceae bacterium AAb-1]|nr:Na+/H+ antiporter NhaA [Chromatiaceae bacterium AAb-1]
MSERPENLQFVYPRFLGAKFFSSLERLLHIEAVGGVVLLCFAIIALCWANSGFAESYEQIWHTQLTLGIGAYQVTPSLHFIINDVLMTVFFLVVGMEIRREIYDGALSDLRAAALPVIAAIGGVVTPALIFIALNSDEVAQRGWAIPMATDIAFAIGVLALLGKSVPPAVRVFLLSLAIIDDIIAIAVIAIFYSDGLNYAGIIPVGAGMALVLLFQRLGLGSGWAYIVPGAILWCGLLYMGIHPTLAGVILGFMTPVIAFYRRDDALLIATEAVHKFKTTTTDDLAPLKQLHYAQRELLPPVIRIQLILHPWVMYTVMPLFALANAGVSLDGFGGGSVVSQHIMLGVFAGLLLGKPVGITLSCWLAMKSGLCKLPADLSLKSLLLIGLLAGIGFTMSIFIAMLSFSQPEMLAAAKTGVLLASLCSGCIGLSMGYLLYKRKRSIG